MSLNIDIKDPIILSELIIRRLHENDADAFKDLLNRDDQDFSKSYTNYPYEQNGFSRESAKALIETFDEAWKSINARILYILKEKEIIGALILSENEDSSASISYFISKEFRGNNYAAKAQYETMKQLCRQTLKLNFTAQVLPNNKISISILKKNGFQYIGDLPPNKKQVYGQ